MEKEDKKKPSILEAATRLGEEVMKNHSASHTPFIDIII